MIRKKSTKTSNSYFPSKGEFLKLAKRGNLIPVYKEILADLETPLSSFLKIGSNNYAYLLESVEGGERPSGDVKPFIQIFKGGQQL